MTLIKKEKRMSLPSVFTFVLMSAYVWTFIKADLIPTQRINVDYTQTCAGENGQRDFWCENFCPYLHRMFSIQLNLPLTCSYGINRLNCSEVTDACYSDTGGKTWCSVLYDIFHSVTYIPGKSVEWISCSQGHIPPTCEEDPECIKWCNAIIQSYASASDVYLECIRTGVSPPDCNDEPFCEEFCTLGRAATPNTPDFIFRCAFYGHP